MNGGSTQNSKAISRGYCCLPIEMLIYRVQGKDFASVIKIPNKPIFKDCYYLMRQGSTL